MLPLSSGHLAPLGSSWLHLSRRFSLTAATRSGTWLGLPAPPAAVLAGDAAIGPRRRDGVAAKKMHRGEAPDGFPTSLTFLSVFLCKMMWINDDT